MTLALVVQHDPRRADLLPRLLPDLPGAQVVYDPEPDGKRNPWRTYLACLQAAADSDAGWSLLIQDDAIVCLDFLATVEKVIAARPDSPICLFIPGVGLLRQAMLDACYRGKQWAEIPRPAFVPVVAVVWPRADVEALLAYVEAKPFARGRTSDDANVAEWMRVTRRTFWMTVPSLVDHPDDVPSLMNQPALGGRNPARTACCWAGKEWSPSQIDWT